MTDNILLVVDNLNWGGNHSADAVAYMLRGRFNIGITDIAGLTNIDDFAHYNLIMAWLDSAEVAVNKLCVKHNIAMASRIAGWKGVWRTCRMGKHIHRNIKGVVCCNPELQLSAEKIYPKNVVTIMNGVDAETFKPSESYASNGGWLWVGRTHDEQKDYELLKKVDAEYKRKIDIVSQKWKDGRVVPTDWPREMVKRYQGAKGFIRTSRNEGSSNCLLEAMSCGLPVVATPTGVAPRLLSPNCLATSTKHIARTMREFDDAEKAMKQGIVNRIEILNSWQWKYRREDYATFFEECLK